MEFTVGFGRRRVPAPAAQGRGQVFMASHLRSDNISFLQTKSSDPGGGSWDGTGSHTAFLNRGRPAPEQIKTQGIKRKTEVGNKLGLQSALATLGDGCRKNSRWAVEMVSTPTPLLFSEMLGHAGRPPRSRRERGAPAPSAQRENRRYHRRRYRPLSHLLWARGILGLVAWLLELPA